MMKYVLLAAVLALSGCTAVQQGYFKAGETTAKSAFDSEAALLLQAPCAMNVGSYWRVLTGSQRSAVDILCGK